MSKDEKPISLNLSFREEELLFSALAIARSKKMEIADNHGLVFTDKDMFNLQLRLHDARKAAG